MARKMHRQFLEQDDIASYQWDPNSMHIFCFCHKITLIVNAGLAALGVKAPPPLKVKQNDRGHFPIFETIAEEEEEGDEDEPTVVRTTPVEAEDSDIEIEHDLQDLVEDTQPDTQPEEVVAELDDEGEWDAADAEEESIPELLLEDNEAQPTHRREANHVDFILRKVRPFFQRLEYLLWSNSFQFDQQVDFITRRITRSAAWRKEFERVSAQKGFTGSLIAGYGIRWNIKYISRHKAWLAREVSNILCLLFIWFFFATSTNSTLCNISFIRLLINFVETTWTKYTLNIGLLARTKKPTVISMNWKWRRPNGHKYVRSIPSWR